MPSARDRFRRCSLALGCAAALCVAAGCNILSAVGYVAAAAHEAGSTMIPAEYDGLQGEDFAVIVSVDRSVMLNHPRLVNRMTNAITTRLAGEAGATGFVPGPRILEFQFNTPAWTTWSYARVAEEFTVSRLVVVDLFEYRLNEPGNRYILAGSAAARVGVFEEERGTEEFAFLADVQVRFPDGTGYTRAEISEEAVAQMLELRFANRVSWLMYDHEEPNSIEY